jgi:hypothetical protein
MIPGTGSYLKMRKQPLGVFRRGALLVVIKIHIDSAALAAPVGDIVRCWEFASE